MKLRCHHPQRVAAAKAGFSERTGLFGLLGWIRWHPQRLAVLTDGLVLKLSHHAVPAHGPESSVS